MSTTDLSEALACIARRGRALREAYHFDWTPQAEQAAQGLRHKLQEGCRPRDELLSIVAIVGGASSGKSTVFNNLLGGRLTSRVTARGHATRGPIAAAHELQRRVVEQALADKLLMPAFAPRESGLDDNVEGSPDVLHVVYHDIDALRNVLLLDMPDLTSEPARLEGDVALAMLPWFDRLIVMVDHERWFDRQTIGRLHSASAQFGQERLVVFNRDKDGRLSQEERARLRQQADRLGAEAHLVLEFRHGRGCRTFPPGTFDTLLDHLNRPPPQRDRRLVEFLGRTASLILNNNAERRARIGPLRESLEQAAERAVPSRAECFAALMTADERRHLDVLSRVLRIVETREWMAEQADRIRDVLRRHVPVVGRLIAARRKEPPEAPVDPSDRQAIGWEVFRSRCMRQLADIDAAAAGSDFWSEVRRWTSTEPPGSARERIEERRASVASAVEAIGESIKRWTTRVADECSGTSPRLVGAVGAASLAGAIVLVAVSGPVGALTLPAITTALGGALGALAASAGVGALGGPALGRLLAVVRENLLGSEEFDAVRNTTDAYRDLIANCGREAVGASFAAANELILPENGDLAGALDRLRIAAEIDA